MRYGRMIDGAYRGRSRLPMQRTNLRRRRDRRRKWSSAVAHCRVSSLRGRSTRAGRETVRQKSRKAEKLAALHEAIKFVRRPSRCGRNARAICRRIRPGSMRRKISVHRKRKSFSCRLWLEHRQALRCAIAGKIGAATAPTTRVCL